MHGQSRALPLDRDCRRSVFKPFVFGKHITQVPWVLSPVFGEKDPIKEIPRFKTQVDRRHELYKQQQLTLEACEGNEEALRTLQQKQREMETDHLLMVSKLLDGTKSPVLPDLSEAFSLSVEKELALYKEFNKQF